jgi:addiction module HigA family antidote
VTHPGRLLNDTVLPATGKTLSEIAKLLGVSRQTLHNIIGCRQPVTPAMALRFGKLFGNGPHLWLNMQTAYELWQAQQSTDVSRIPTLKMD